jgi:hypothetical protein
MLLRNVGYRLLPYIELYSQNNGGFFYPHHRQNDKADIVAASLSNTGLHKGSVLFVLCVYLFLRLCACINKCRKFRLPALGVKMATCITSRGRGCCEMIL